MSKPTFLQGCLISLGGVALAFFGCLGAVAAFAPNGDSPGFFFGAAVFFLGLVVVLVGAIRAILALFRSRQTETPPPPAPGQS